MNDLKMNDTCYCEKCGGVAYGNVTLTSDFLCGCRVPATFTEQQRDEFTAAFLKWYRNNAVPSQTGHLSSEQLLEQYKNTL